MSTTTKKSIHLTAIEDLIGSFCHSEEIFEPTNPHWRLVGYYDTSLLFHEIKKLMAYCEMHDLKVHMNAAHFEEKPFPVFRIRVSSNNA